MRQSFDERAKAAVFHVEANSYERHSLWVDFSPSSPHPRFESDLEWSGSDAEGVLVIVGHLDGMPVTLTLMVDDIGGKPVIFYYSPSQVSDSRMIELWFSEMLPVPQSADGRRCHTDAMNFAHCLHAIRDAA